MQFSPTVRKAILDGDVALGNVFHAYLSLWRDEEGEVSYHPRQHAEMYGISKNNLPFSQPIEWHNIPCDIAGIAIYNAPDDSAPLTIMAFPAQKGVSITLTSLSLVLQAP